MALGDRYESVSCRHLSAGGFETRYWQAGDPQNEAVVLLHDGGWGADGLGSWAEVIQVLSESYCVFAPDMLGFGGTVKAVFFDQSHYESRIRHIANFCEAVGLDAPAHFVGTSFGGSLVLHGSTAGLWPLASVTSVCGTGGPWRIPEHRRFLEEHRPGRTYIEELVKLLANDAAGLSEHIDHRYQMSLDHGHYACMMSPRLRHPELGAPQFPTDFPKSLNHAPCSVQLVTTTDDRLLEFGWADNITAVAPGVHVREIAGPHSPNLTHAATLTECLTDFMEGNTVR